MTPEKSTVFDSAGGKKVKILIAVWGGEYIERFERFGLSSFLAEGNLPALAARCDVELVLLTCAEDEPRFEALPLMEQIRRYASVRYIPIDDLIAPGHYSTTLTLAFTRGVAAFGEDMTRMWFVFWNADFVLSDGAFAHLADLIEQDHKVIITGTVRAVSEHAEAILDGMRQDAHAPLSASSRELVDLVFRYTHPHHVAKTVNRAESWTSMPSQMLWRVDDRTQLARFFKAFMFCLRPTRVVTQMNGPCDYAFVPEYCPGEPQHMIQDSDDAFLLELQPSDAEAEFISPGWPDEAERRACMNEWLTAEHLDTGRQIVTLRSGDTPEAEIDAAAEWFDDYLDRFLSGVEAPRSHAGQYYWLFGCAAWRFHRNAHLPGQPDPPELTTTVTLDELENPTHARHRAAAADAAESRRRGPLGAVRRLLFGAAQRPARLHPDAAATPLLEQTAEDAKAAAGETGRVLSVAPLGSWADWAFPHEDPRYARLEPAIADSWTLTGPPYARAALIYQRPGGELDLADIVDRIGGALEPGAMVMAVIHAPAYLGAVDWMAERLDAGSPLESRLSGLEITRHQGDAADLAYVTMAHHLFQALRHGRIRTRPWTAVRLAWLMLKRPFVRTGAPSDRTIVAVISGRWAGAGAERVTGQTRQSAA